jgi:hypothetical protein
MRVGGELGWYHGFRPPSLGTGVFLLSSMDWIIKPAARWCEDSGGSLAIHPHGSREVQL